MAVFVEAAGRDDIPRLEMPDRFRHEITYFMTPAGEEGVPDLGEDEYWVRRSVAEESLESGVVEVVSPLDSENMAEIELTDYHERWLEWLLEHSVEHMRLLRS